MEPIEECGVLEFCAGFPLVSVRRFSDDERNRMQSALRRAWLFLLLSFTPLPLVVLVFWTLSRVPSTSSHADVLLTCVVTFTILAIPLAFILPYFSIRSLRRARRELGPGQIKRFSGTLKGASGQDLVQQTLIQLGLIEPTPTKQWIEIIPATGRVLSVNGRTPKSAMDVETRKVASPVATLSSIPTMNLPSAVKESGAHAVSSRALNAVELQELKAHARRAWRPRLLPAVLLSAWFFPLSILSVFKGHLAPPDAINAISFFSLGVMACLSDLALFAGIRTARQIGGDIRIGAVTLNVSVGSLPVGTAEGGHARPGITGYDEILPHSGRPWTESGSPAAWRKIVTG